jgi:hypothetical protein
MEKSAATRSASNDRQAAANRASRRQSRASTSGALLGKAGQRTGTEFDAHNERAAAHRRLVDNSPRVSAQRKQIESAFGMPVQRQDAAEEDELLQGKFEPVQRQGPEEEELLQGKFEAIQRQGPEEEELLQGKFGAAQLKQESGSRANNTGLPDNLKAGIEHLSGMSMDQVKVHYNSSQPAQLNALAYAQGADIHVAPGQEQHLPHEAWHVVQQAQGRVKATMQMKDGVPVNDDAGLEHEADLMGAKATQIWRSEETAFEFANHPEVAARPASMADQAAPIQRAEAVSGGSFDTKRFDPYFWNQSTAATKHYGAKIILEFTPKSELGANGDHVSLVQSVKDEIKLSKKKSTPSGFVTEQTSASAGNKTAGFGLRTTGQGWAIDQQLYDKQGNLVSLDPRYAEQRTDQADPMKARPGGDLSNLVSAGGALEQGHVTSANKSGGTWDTALLSDEPTVPVQNATISGKQEFEVTALHESGGGDAYVGSVKWGWEVSGGKAKIIPLSTVSQGSASAFLKGAAGAWNAMQVPNKRENATANLPVVKQLPT